MYCKFNGNGSVFHMHALPKTSGLSLHYVLTDSFVAGGITSSTDSIKNICIHGRMQPKVVGGGQSEVQKDNLLLMMIWHQKKGTCSQKGHFFPQLLGGGRQLPPAPPAKYGHGIPYNV